MKRGLILAAVGLLLFAAAVYTGFLVGARVAPQRLRAEVAQRLADALGARVALGEVGLHFSLRRLSLRVDIHDADARFGPPDRETAHLTVQRLQANLDPFALLFGRLRARSVVAMGPDLVLPLPEAAAGGAGAAGGTPSALAEGVGALFRLQAGVGSLRGRHCLLPVPTVDIEAGRLAVREGQEDLPVLADTHLTLRCSALRRLGRGDLEATLPGRRGPGASLSARFSASAHEASGQLDVSDLDLGDPGLLLRSRGVTSWRGRVDAHVSWKQEDGSPVDLGLEMRGSDLSGALPIGAEALRVDLEGPRLALRLAAGEQRLLLRSAEVRAAGTTVRAKGSLDAGPARSARLTLSVELGGIDADRLRRLLDYIPRAERSPIEAVMSHVASGRLTSLAAEAHTTPEGLAAILGGGMLARPGELTVDAAVEDTTLVLGEGDQDRIEDVSGSLDFAGDRLLLANLRGRYRGDPLPQLDATFTGISSVHSLDDLHCDPPPAVPALPGIAALERWIESRREEPERQTWQRVAIQADWIAHPALACTIRDMAAAVVPEEGGIAVQVQHGVWAGLPVDAIGRYVHRGSQNMISLNVHLGTPSRQRRAEIRGPGPWARGRFQAEVTSLGPWSTRGMNGAFQADGGELELRGVSLLFDPAGQVEGNVSVDLGKADPLAYRAAIQVPAVSLADVTAAAGQEQMGLTGTLYGGGAVQGRLVDGDPPLAHAQGVVALDARNGKVRQDLPVILALVVASRPFAPAASRGLLEYRAIDLVGRIEGGWLRSETLTADGRTLRVGASVQVAVAKPHNLEGVVGLFFFPQLDSLIRHLPLLNRVILGSNGNLVGAYFSLHGTWDQPTTRIIPIRSLASSTPVVNGLSDMVIGGIRRIESILTARSSKTPPEPVKEGS